MKNVLLFSWIFLPFYLFTQTTIINDPIINEYGAVTEIDFCENAMTLANNAEQNFAIGDKVLIVQMQGALLNLDNNTNNGQIENLLNAGAYEFNFVKSINLGTINGLQFENKLTLPYNINGKVQVVKVPEYVNVDIQTTLTALPWDGQIGGILAFEASGNIILNSNIFVDGFGFRGGAFLNDDNCYTAVGGYNGFSCNNADLCGAYKGEGNGTLYDLQLTARGRNGNGGGGGNDHNAGGGGGANGGNGGNGGDNDLNTQFCDGSGGLGGDSITLSNNNNKIILGGGGGAGDSNNNSGTEGGIGGGFIYIKANSITSNGFLISANGIGAQSSTGDGAGGGGAGGSIYLDIQQYNDIVQIEAVGGQGGDNTDNTNCTAVGGGGSGGVIWFSQNTVPSNTSININGGVKGQHLSTLCNGLLLGEEDGEDGSVYLNYNPLIANEEFEETTIDVVDGAILCAGDSFELDASINSSENYTFEWIYNNNAISNQENLLVGPTTHGANDYEAFVSWSVFDQNCNESAIVSLFVSNPDLVVFSNPTEITEYGDPVFLHAVVNPFGNYTYEWTPNYVEPNDGPNALTEPFESTTFCATITDEFQCQKTACTFVSVLVPNYGIPDAFSPNGDGNNDFFTVRPNPGLTRTYFAIYNRWGEIVYETAEENASWDGTLKGVAQNEDQYSWFVEFKNENTDEVLYQSGSLSLIR